MRNEEWGMSIADQSKLQAWSKIKHRAKREIKRTRGPGARGLVGSRGKAPSGVWGRASFGFYIQFSSYIRGATLGIMPLVAYTQNTAMHTHVLTQVLYSLFQKLTSVSLSRRACTCPQVSKRFLLIHEKGVFCCIKNATIAEMLPN